MTDVITREVCERFGGDPQLDSSGTPLTAKTGKGNLFKNEAYRLDEPGTLRLVPT